MQVPVTGLAITCGPLVLALASCASLFRLRGNKPQPSALWATGTVTIYSAYAAYAFLRYSVGPPLDLPPWKDPETLDLALCFLLGPIGFVLSIFAGVRGASKWVVIPLVMASVVLFLVGLVAGASV